MLGYRVKPCGTCGFSGLFRKEQQLASKSKLTLAQTKRSDSNKITLYPKLKPVCT